MIKKGSLAIFGFYAIFYETMSFLKNFLLQIAVGVLGFFIADYFLEGVFIEDTRHLFYVGISLGLINFFIRPLLNLLTLPFRILTLGLFSFLINIAIVWLAQAMFTEVIIEGLATIVYVTLIIWILEFVTSTFKKT